MLIQLFRSDPGKKSLKIEVNADYNKVKVEYDVLVQIMEARVEELLSIIDKEIRVSEYYDKLSGIVLVGGGIATIKGIEDFSKNFLEKFMRIGTTRYIGASSPLYVTAVGIVKNVSNSIKYKNIDTTVNKSESTASYEEIAVGLGKKNDKDKHMGFVTIKEFFTDFF